MTIKSTIATIAVAFLAVLTYAPIAGAEAPKDSKKEEKTVIVIVQSGDTLTKIAESHDTTYIRLFNANEFLTNPDIIDVGNEIRIPKADEDLPDRYSSQQVAAVPQQQPVVAGYVATTKPTVRSSQYVSNSTGNTYYRGYCTWYAKERRPDLPNQLGNGGQWVGNAAARGFATGSAPRAGAIAEMPGHVAYVESVNSDGTIVISEMNGPAGFGVVGTRTASANQFRYIY